MPASPRLTARPVRTSISLALLSAFLTTGHQAAAQPLADSRTDFSGTQGHADWSYGYRNVTAEGASTDTYDPVTGFIAFAGGEGRGDWDGLAQVWTGNAWALNTEPEGPWTTLDSESIHPNGENSPPHEEHWVIRRWTANRITSDTPLTLVWHTRKENTAGGGGGGVTGGLWLNGRKLVSATLTGTNSTGITRTNHVLARHGDRIDLVLTPVGIDGSRDDGADGSRQWLTIARAEDSDADGLPDSWERGMVGNLTQLTATGDFDHDGLPDTAELPIGTHPARADTDGDGLSDASETNTGRFVDPTHTGTDPLERDTDHDNRPDGDEVTLQPRTNPLDPDSDDDTYPDGLEVLHGHDPNDAADTLVSDLIAHSIADFSGTQASAAWSHGYRNVSADGGSLEVYDPRTGFTPFPGGDGLGDWNGTTQTWTGSLWDLNTAPAAPWSELESEGAHPNGPTPVHWVIRRWSPASALTRVTPLALRYSVRKDNRNCGNGVTAGLHINGRRADSATIAFNDQTGVTRTVYANIAPTDVVDVILSPRGTDASDADGCDGSFFSLVVDPVLPEPAFQPDGTLFLPVDLPDTDADGMPDLWEKLHFPGDLTRLTATGDFDLDGLPDAAEYRRDTDPTRADTDADGLGDVVETRTGIFLGATDTGTDPRRADTDGDGLNDRAEITAMPATDPNKADSDGDGFSDATERSEGTNPNDGSDHPLSGVIADSVAEFSGVQGRDGWFNGYRRVSPQDDGPYDARTQFIPYPGGEDEGEWDGVTQTWTDGGWEFLNAEDDGPWTYQGPESIHPNGANSTPHEEHWAIRRWVAGELTTETPATILWQVRKENPGGGGVAGLLFVNNTLVDSVVIAGADTTQPRRRVATHLRKGDTVDLALTPENVDGTRSDGADGSVTWFRVDTRVALPVAPTLAVTRTGNNQLTVTSDPQPLPAGFVLEVAPSLAGPWTAQPAAVNTPMTLDLGTGPTRFLRAVKR